MLVTMVVQLAAKQDRVCMFWLLSPEVKSL